MVIPTYDDGPLSRIRAPRDQGHLCDPWTFTNPRDSQQQKQIARYNKHTANSIMPFAHPKGKLPPEKCRTSEAPSHILEQTGDFALLVGLTRKVTSKMLPEQTKEPLTVCVAPFAPASAVRGMIEMKAEKAKEFCCWLQSVFIIATSNPRKVLLINTVLDRLLSICRSALSLRSYAHLIAVMIMAADTYRPMRSTTTIPDSCVFTTVDCWTSSWIIWKLPTWLFTRSSSCTHFSLGPTVLFENRYSTLCHNAVTTSNILAFTCVALFPMIWSRLPWLPWRTREIGSQFEGTAGRRASHSSTVYIIFSIAMLNCWRQQQCVSDKRPNFRMRRCASFPKNVRI